jgi:N-acetylneuraminic acid mutarotase
VASAPEGFLGRTGHTTVWTGTEVIVFGGRNDNSWGAKIDDGAAYNPSTNQWRTLPPLPGEAGTGYDRHVAVWTGTEMIIFGGIENIDGRGAAYSPSTDTWRAIAPVPEAASLFDALAGYSTSTAEMIVWGGEQSGGDCVDGGRFCAGGRAYNPATDTWTNLPFAPINGRTRARGGFVGADFVVWGGVTAVGSGLTGLLDGARYNPAAKTWVTLPSAPATVNGIAFSTSVVGGSELFIWGGQTSSLLAETSTGGRYLVGGGWAPIGAPPATVLEMRRSEAASWFGAGRLWVWSGASMSAPPANQSLKGGAWYDAVLASWGPMARIGEPTARAGAGVVWTGSEAVIWGGYPAGKDWSQSFGDEVSAFADGAIFRP